jgi:hypothetical protein
MVVESFTMIGLKHNNSSKCARAHAGWDRAYSAAPCAERYAMMGTENHPIQVLDSDGEKDWRKWIASARSRLVNSDYSGVEYLLDAYGGMRSFNDLVIGQSMVGGAVSWNRMEMGPDTIKNAIISSSELRSTRYMESAGGAAESVRTASLPFLSWVFSSL